MVPRQASTLCALIKTSSYHGSVQLAFTALHNCVSEVTRQECAGGRMVLHNVWGATPRTSHIPKHPERNPLCFHPDRPRQTWQPAQKL